ncbi:sulfatase-like hydrolase/transferase [Flavobacteriaceae bacterium]|nr:sulfatase-like hydrolase/transferase [Flavobacteriaceae bacterium]
MNFKLKTTALILLGLFVNCQNKEQKQSKPNVILVIVDDMGFSDLGAYGSEISTPNIDRLAAEGVRFSNAYNTSKCFPSRACILTGLYSQQTGYNKDFKQPMRNAITLGELFKSAGYTTLWSGKHHSTENPVDRGFDHYSGLLDGASNHFNPGKQREGEAPPAHKVGKTRSWAIEGEIFTPYTPESKNFYTTDTFTDYALGWINEIEAEQPFFLYLSYTAPHDPLMAWPEDIKKYEDKYNDGYEAIRKARFQKQLDSGILPKNSKLSIAYHKKWSTLSEEKRKEESHTMAVYAAMIDRIDQNIGRLTDTLKEHGTLENTLILFTSDNGHWY